MYLFVPLQPLLTVKYPGNLITAKATKGVSILSPQPVAAILRGEGDGAKRSLVCSLCAMEWDFRRLFVPTLNLWAEGKATQSCN